jgi:hypothetical protein
MHACTLHVMTCSMYIYALHQWVALVSRHMGPLARTIKSGGESESKAIFFLNFDLNMSMTMMTVMSCVIKILEKHCFFVVCEILIENVMSAKAGPQTVYSPCLHVQQPRGTPCTSYIQYRCTEVSNCMMSWTRGAMHYTYAYVVSIIGPSIMPDMVLPAWPYGMPCTGIT